MSKRLQGNWTVCESRHSRRHRGFDHLRLRGDAEAPNLTGRDQLLKRGEQVILLKNAARWLVQEEEIDVVRAQGAQACVEAWCSAATLKCPADDMEASCRCIALRAPGARRSSERASGFSARFRAARGSGQDTEFGGHQHLIAAATKKLAEQRLGFSVAVGAGGVDRR